MHSAIWWLCFGQTLAKGMDGASLQENSGAGMWSQQGVHWSTVVGDLQLPQKIPAKARLKGECIKENMRVGYLVLAKVSFARELVATWKNY